MQRCGSSSPPGVVAVVSSLQFVRCRGLEIYGFSRWPLLMLFQESLAAWREAMEGEATIDCFLRHVYASPHTASSVTMEPAESQDFKVGLSRHAADADLESGTRAEDPRLPLTQYFTMFDDHDLGDSSPEDECAYDWLLSPEQRSGDPLCKETGADATEQRLGDIVCEEPCADASGQPFTIALREEAGEEDLAACPRAGGCMPKRSPWADLSDDSDDYDAGDATSRLAPTPRWHSETNFAMTGTFDGACTSSSTNDAGSFRSQWRFLPRLCR